MSRLSWERMVELEPRLKQVDEHITRALQVAGTNKWVIYEEAKRIMASLAGWSAMISELKNSIAYEVGIQHITDELGI